MQVAGDKDPESIATCPYNPAHRLPLFRMKRHLVKCRRNYPDEIIIPCPLNITHRIPKPELAYHIEHCPDRVHLDRKSQIPAVIDKILPIQTPDISPPTDECWDNEDNPTYDPTSHVMEKPIYRTLNCESKAKRRDFRFEERNRISRLNNERDHASSASTSAQATELGAAGSVTCSRRPFTRSAGAAHKRNLDPYKVNDLLQALDQDQKQLLDSLQAVGDGEAAIIFPTENCVQKEAVNENAADSQNIYSDQDFPSLECANGLGRYGNVGRRCYAANFQGKHGNARK